MIDQAYALFGMPEYVTAHLRIVRREGKVNDYYDIRLGYANFSAILKCSYLVKDAGPRYIIHGEKGSFQKFGIDPQEELMKQGKLPEGDNWGTEPAEEWGALVYDKNNEEVAELVESIPGDYRIYYNNIFSAIREDAELLVKPEETVDVLQILEACLQSNREKRSVKM